MHPGKVWKLLSLRALCAGTVSHTSSDELVIIVTDVKRGKMRSLVLELDKFMRGDRVPHKRLEQIRGFLIYVVVSGLQAVCHVRIMRRWSSNLEQWTIQLPRLWVPSPYSLSPTRRSKPAFQ